jgi:hypothetical protein
VSNFEDSLEAAVVRFRSAHPGEKDWEISSGYVQIKGNVVTLTGPLGSRSAGVAKGLDGMAKSIFDVLESLRNEIISAAG